jgi:histidine ammonia-lyase
VHPEIINLLVDFLNHDITPIVPQKGSVGASGDLAPLAQVALCLIGEGEVWFKGKKVPSDFAIEQIGKKPIELHAKEGLSLINGTAVMSALAAYACYHMQTLVKSADIISALTLDALEGSIKAFNPAISQLKPHPGQLEVCSNLNRLLEHSEIINSHANCGKVQDPYSLRCIPQVHGAIRQTLRHTIEVLETEINSVTDNPLIFPEQDLVLSGGNFHGQAIAFALDYLGMGLSEIVSISERRIEKMMNPTFSNLPPFLIEDGGLNSGLMIAQVTAAALVSDSKFLSNTASTDSVPTSTDKEDHVSMGVTAGRKLIPMIENAYQCLAIELLCATQALHFNKEYRTSPALEAVRSLVLNHSPFLKKDQVLNKTIVDLEHLIQSKNIISKAEQICGPLS